MPRVSGLTSVSFQPFMPSVFLLENPMPVKALKAYAEESGKSMAEVEKAWAEAKHQADGKFKKRDFEYWKYVNATTRMKLGLNKK